MKEASTFDGQLSPVCPWCGQARCQVWCNEIALEKSMVSRAAGGAHSRSTIADVLLKESWVAGSFFGCELYCSVEYRVYTLHFTVLVVRLSFWL